MSSTEQFSAVMREWVKVFMTRSMHDLLPYLKHHDLTMAQYSTLMRLYHQELHQERQCGVGDVGSHLGITTAAASQLVDKLVQQGLLVRTEAEHDRRVKHLALTEKGRALMEESFRVRLGWVDTLGQSLTPDRRLAVIAALRHLLNAAEQSEQARGDA
jgi:DNA-binding MarR family transcriptional regulator